MNRCTVIVVNWNSWEILAECLDKLQKQVFRDFRVTVVDNSSIQPVPVEFLKRYSEVQFIVNRENVGFAAANNQRIFASNDNEFVALLNPDAFPDAEWLQRLVDAADHYLEYAAFGSRQLMDREVDVLDGEGDVVHVSGLVWRNGFGRRASDDIAPREIFTPCAAAALYRKEALRAVGGFDEDFFCYIEDVDLGFRLQLKGYRCLLVPGAVVHHVGSATTGGRQSDFAIYHGHRNMVWMYVKDMPGWIFWVCLPLHIAMNLSAIVLFTFRGRFSTIIKAKRDAIFGLRRMWRKRREIQNARSVPISRIWRIMDKSLFLRR